MSLWNGTIVSQGWAGGDCGIDRQGQASPIEVFAITVRVEGQIGARPFTKTSQRVGRGTIGTEEARVDGCDSR